MLLLLPGILSFKMLAYPVHATDRFKKEIRIPLARIQCYLQFLLISMRKVRLYGYSTLLLLPGIQPLHVAFPVYSTAFFVDLNLIPFAYNQSYQRFVPLSLRKVRLRGFSMFVLLPGIQQSSPLTHTPPFSPPPPSPPPLFFLTFPDYSASSCSVLFKHKVIPCVMKIYLRSRSFCLASVKKKKRKKKKKKEDVPLVSLCTLYLHACQVRATVDD